MKCIRNHLMEKSSSTNSSSQPPQSSPSSSSPSSVSAQQNNHHFFLHNWIAAGELQDPSQWLQSVNISRLEELLKRNRQKIDSMDERGHTLLHLAILANRIEIVQLLINLGANVTLANRDGWSPLHIAAYSGNSDIISFLLQNKL